MPGILFRSLENEPQTVAAARELCRKGSATPRLTSGEKVSPVSRITAVGACLGPNGDLSKRDGRYLTYALEGLMELNVLVSEKFELTLLNISFGQDQDFLAPEVRIPTDLLLVCWVADLSGSAFNLGRPAFNTGQFLTSPHHFEKDAWSNAASQSGTNYIIPFGYGTEVGVNHFLNKDQPFVEIPGPRALLGMPMLVNKNLATVFARQ